jgi:DNA-binding MarR family transcriptional regulator
VSTNKVQNAHIIQSLPGLHRSLIDLVGEMNRPERDAAMLDMAGLSLERALFPLLVLVERLGPIGVGDLAGRVGRDYTTVSRQVARLEELGLVSRRPGTADRRVREATITPQGKTATDAVDAARERGSLALFKDWSRRDFDELLRLMRMLADDITALSREGL